MKTEEEKVHAQADPDHTTIAILVVWTAATVPFLLLLFHACRQGD